jgi:hypothetical protein
MAEALERRLLERELLARIPVPPEAIPKLAGDVETIRRIEPRDAPAPGDAARAASPRRGADLPLPSGLR